MIRDSAWLPNPIPGNEIFQKCIPWVTDLTLVVTGFGPRSTKLSVYVRSALTYRKVAEFFRGNLLITDSAHVWGDLSDAARLCLASLPKDFPIGRSDFPQIMEDPFWYEILSVATVHYVMQS